ncbi:hypothetical protein BJX65DRAFT_315493 [Aspergillus insuetus]
MAFKINYYLNAKRSILYCQCSARNALCLSTIVRMLGNTANLSMILKWYTSFWDKGDNGQDL